MDNCNSCYLNTPDNKIDIQIQQLKRELEDLTKTTRATILIQNNKIEETCVYLKNNLSNELRVMIDSMNLSGELDRLIIEVVSDKITLLEDTVFPVGHVKRYGAIGDGVFDDTSAIIKAVACAKANNKPLIFDDGKYLISSDIDARLIKNIDIAGEIVTNNDSVFSVGGVSSDGSGYNIRIRKVKNIKVSGLKNAILNIDFCEKLHLFADADDATISSIAYCQFYGAYAKEIILESVGENPNAIAWINENIFRIKRVEKISISGNYLHNNNRFEHINFEKGILNLNGARNNYISARAEGGVTINSTNKAEANFIEKEYYYRYYFGNDVQEDENGTVSYHMVNKLQSERLLKRIDKGNRHFPIGSLQFTESGTFTGNSFNTIFRSNLIPITNTFALKLKSDAKNFRTQLKFYDENKNPILTEVDNFTDGKMTFIGGSGWTYTISANVDSDIVTFFPGMAKYVEYQVLFGNLTETEIGYVTIKLLKYTNTDINIFDTMQNDIYTTIPNKGYWEQGTILYSKSPKSGSAIGIVCVESGVPGIWKSWGTIS